MTFNEAKQKLEIDSRKGGLQRSFMMEILEPFESEIPQSKIDYKSMCTLTLQELEKALKDSKLVGEQVKIAMTDQELTIRASGDLGESQNTWNNQTERIYNIKADRSDDCDVNLFFAPCIGT